MTPTRIDHAMVSGDTATPFVGQVIDEAGVGRDITGWRLRYVVYFSEAPDAEVAIDKSTASGGVVVTDPLTGAYRIEYDADDTNDIGGRTLPAELEALDIAGALETVGVGALAISRDFAT